MINPITTGDTVGTGEEPTPLAATQQGRGKTIRQPREAPREATQDRGTMLPPFPPLTNGKKKLCFLIIYLSYIYRYI